VATALLAVTGCASAGTGSPSTASSTAQASAASSPSATTTEGVIGTLLTEFDITLSAPSASAGEVVFEVRNAGALPHEVILVRTELDAAALPVDEGAVDEDELEIVTEVRDLAAGDSATMTAELEAGHYVLICNLSGHYESGVNGPGMKVNFDVT
jgi:uncharacterized cupredoxin-like copper-binding protein